jgi:hypothetical protein
MCLFATYPMRDDSPNVALAEGIRNSISGATTDQSPEWRQALLSIDLTQGPTLFNTSPSCHAWVRIVKTWL